MSYVSNKCFRQLHFENRKLSRQQSQKVMHISNKGFFYWKECEAPLYWNGPPVDSGLLVISKYPIV